MSFWCLVFCFVCFTWIFSPYILCSILTEGRYTKSQPLLNEWESWTNVEKLIILLIQGKSNQPDLLHFRDLGWCQCSILQEWQLGQVPPRHTPELIKSQPQIFKKGTPPPLQFKRFFFGYLHFYAAKDHLESLQLALPVYCHLAQLVVHSLSFFGNQMMLKRCMLGDPQAH